ncbi:YdcF family protein [Luteolibacter sp. SL250]|uniref:YdcF family protein n=1 Tax=Luteolibacter sp. SL250 TaxID=2995170 RepID=UPI00226D727C|nr:YdcF family protein [Luteolibacter sp. SL250]WAC17760.1 YdcF family protein [Luteolibacter sp. SL250]
MTKPRRFRWLVKSAAVVVAVVIVWLIWLGISIHRFGSEDQARPSDCIIVLGAAVHGDVPSPVFLQRLRHGVDLQHRGMARKIIFTGARAEGDSHSESGMGEFFARSMGIPADNILIEERSTTTLGNLVEAAALMKEHRLESAIIVSDPDHMKRAMRMARDLGIRAYSSPTPTSRYQSWKTRLPFLLREMYFFHHYLVTGD